MLQEIHNETTMTASTFWQSVDILIKKSHVVNKRVWGSNILHKSSCRPISAQWCLPDQCAKLGNTENVESYVDTVCKNLQLEQCDNPDSNYNIDIVLTELLPKNYSDNRAIQLIFLVKDKDQVTFYDITPENYDQNLCPGFSFSLLLNNKTILLKSTCDSNSKSFQWLIGTVLPQIIKWGEESASRKTNAQFCGQTLAIVSTDQYYRKYNDLKIKYGKEMVKIWPECTDPSKFVYEDVAIATYLLLLWDEERALQGSSSLQSFVDLGCGNGLLVYILSKEGHPGVGIDVRKRQIWDMFGADVKLEEKAVIPSDMHLFPNTDWIIGNHSDELTPWIPVIAARSSYKCNFFLLPCCAYNFDGTKYQRQNSSKSQYTEYLEYIKQLCEDVGFRTDVDRLKIPSTKRICLVGRGRTYDEKSFEEKCNLMQNLINGKEDLNKNDNIWIDEFKSRDPVEKVKNCTQIDKNLIQSIVGYTTDYLLKECAGSDSWSQGRTADINELVKLIPQDHLKALKSECGGLQTLLKNNHHIFKVQSGKVQLRYPKTIEEVEKDSQYKKKKSKSNIRVQCRPCWFYNHHPQGCPLSDQKCSFLHSKS